MRLHGLVRGGYGAIMLLWPDRVVALYSGQRPRRGDAPVARVLGARHLLQALACAGTPTRSVLLLGAETDLAHAASALGLAVLDRPRRRAGLVDAAVAALFAAASVAGAAQAPHNPPRQSDDRLGDRLAVLRDRAASVLAPRLVPSRLLRPARLALRSAS